MTVSRLLTKATNHLKLSPSPQLDAEILLAFVLRQSRTAMLTDLRRRIKTIKLIYFYCLVWLRKQGWPIAYLVGVKEFYGRDFKVTSRTLIPRPETELLIEKALDTIRANGTIQNVADIGTGSGCLAISLALEVPHLKIFATDNSSTAIKVAKQNALDYKVSNRIHFELGNLVEPAKDIQLDIVMANLPYVTKDEYQTNLELKFEPKNALLVQPGLFNDFCHQLSTHPELKYIFIETSPLMLDKWLVILKKYYETNMISILPDLSGRSRLIMVDLKPPPKV